MKSSEIVPERAAWRNAKKNRFLDQPGTPKQRKYNIIKSLIRCQIHFNNAMEKSHGKRSSVAKFGPTRNRTKKGPLFSGIGTSLNS